MLDASKSEAFFSLEVLFASNSICAEIFLAESADLLNLQQRAKQKNQLASIFSNDEHKGVNCRWSEWVSALCASREVARQTYHKISYDIATQAMLDTIEGAGRESRPEWRGRVSSPLVPDTTHWFCYV